jgi:hypothetical protein
MSIVSISENFCEIVSIEDSKIKNFFSVEIGMKKKVSPKRSLGTETRFYPLPHEDSINSPLD